MDRGCLASLLRSQDRKRMRVLIVCDSSVVLCESVDVLEMGERGELTFDS
jgi:hypothetical protein